MKYRIVINGSNYILNNEGIPTRMGFYATRFIDASSATEAEKKAIESIKNDPTLNEGILNDSKDQPILSIENIEESIDPGGPEKGYTFYVEEYN